MPTLTQVRRTGATHGRLGVAAAILSVSTPGIHLTENAPGPAEYVAACSAAALDRAQLTVADRRAIDRGTAERLFPRFAN